MKYLVIGHGGHGKDFVAELLGVKFQASSAAALDIFIWHDWGRFRYDSKVDCWNDRRNNRQKWYDLICEYNKDDKARLAKDILKRNDLYCGMRCDKELAECKKQGIFDFIIWVDACERLPKEPSNKTVPESADYYIDNNGSKEYTMLQVEEMIDLIKNNEVYA